VGGRDRDQNQTERFRSELSSRRRAKGESLQAVYQDIRRLVALAFPGQSGAKPGSVYEIVARDSFLVAIDNPAIRRRILERDPPPDTLDAALTAAVKLEALDSTEMFCNRYLCLIGVLSKVMYLKQVHVLSLL